MHKKLHIKKGDQVVVISGNEKGKTGRVLEVLVDKNRAIVEGVNIISVHTRPNAANPDGGIVKKEGSIHISNLLHVDPKDGKPCRIGRKIDEKGNKVRYSKRSGEVIK
ncbi:MAG: 50S ribosomal protein L24 [Salibacteraceae bacterium]